MADGVKSFILFVEALSGQFDSDGLYEAVSGLAVGKVWNFISGAYVFKSLKSSGEISQCLRDEHFPPHVAIEIDPANASGMLPKAAWESWFGDIFLDDLEKIGKAKGWSSDRTKTMFKKKGRI